MLESTSLARKEMILKAQTAKELDVGVSISVQSTSHQLLAFLRVLFLGQIVLDNQQERKGEHLHVLVE